MRKLKISVFICVHLWQKILMNILSREDLRNQLKRRDFAPVYLLFGAETYLRDLAAKAIADLVLADSSLREFNETEFSLSNAPVQHALASPNKCR